MTALGPEHVPNVGLPGRPRPTDRAGPVVIALADVVTGKPVPPRASVRARVPARDVELHSFADWAEVVRALRTVWLRRMVDPTRTVPALAELSARMVRSAVEAWNDAAARWWGRSRARPSRAAAE